MRFLVASIVIASSPAAADDGRWIIGNVTVGLGKMSHACDGCETTMFAGNASFYLGGFVTRHLAIVGEVDATANTVGEMSGLRTSLVEVAVTGAAQLWLTRRLWVKAGLGSARLDDEVDDGVDIASVSPGEYGFAVLTAAGVELYAARGYALELQGRVIDVAYPARGWTSAATFGVGVTFY